MKDDAYFCAGSFQHRAWPDVQSRRAGGRIRRSDAERCMRIRGWATPALNFVCRWPRAIHPVVAGWYGSHGHCRSGEGSWGIPDWLNGYHRGLHGDCLAYLCDGGRPGVFDGFPRETALHCSLGEAVQLRTGEANCGPQLHLWDTGREVRRLPAPNLYGAGDRAGTVYLTGDRGKSGRGGPGRAGGGSGGYFHCTWVGRKCRGEDRGGVVEYGDGAQILVSLFSGATVALGSIGCI